MTDNFGRFHDLPIIISGMLNFCTYDMYLYNIYCDTSLTKALQYTLQYISKIILTSEKTAYSKSVRKNYHSVIL